jgi:hypothetical protein
MELANRPRMHESPILGAPGGGADGAQAQERLRAASRLTTASRSTIDRVLSGNSQEELKQMHQRGAQ